MVMIVASFCRWLFGCRVRDIEGRLGSGPLSKQNEMVNKVVFAALSFCLRD